MMEWLGLGFTAFQQRETENENTNEGRYFTGKSRRSEYLPQDWLKWTIRTSKTLKSRHNSEFQKYPTHLQQIIQHQISSKTILLPEDHKPWSHTFI